MRCAAPFRFLRLRYLVDVCCQLISFDYGEKDRRKSGGPNFVQLMMLPLKLCSAFGHSPTFAPSLIQLSQQCLKLLLFVLG